MSKKRGSFSGGLGFVFAAAGSAVGLGNLWRFPYYAAKYGGGTFIFIYIILALTFGFSLLTAEIAIGRKTKLSPILAYKKLCSKFSFLGYLALFRTTALSAVGLQNICAFMHRDLLPLRHRTTFSRTLFPTRCHPLCFS